MTVKSKNENCFPPRSTLHGKEEKLSMVTIALDTQSDATKMSDIKHQQFVEEISAVLGEIMKEYWPLISCQRSGDSNIGFRF